MARGRPRSNRYRQPPNPFAMRGMGRMPRDFHRETNRMIQTTTGVMIGAGTLMLGYGTVSYLAGAFHP